MRAISFFTLSLTLAVFANSTFAQSIERKIIIQDGRFNYTTIDPEFQLATLHTGNITEALKKEKKLAVPAGRNYNDPINPFAWDICKGDFYGINFLNHPLNDRNEAIKRFPVNKLVEWSDKITVQDMLMKSVDENMLTYNAPYMAMLNRSSVLNNFFYDAIAVSDSSYYMVIANKGELSLWNYNGISWKQGKIQSFPVTGYFTLLALKKQLYIFLNSGSAYLITKDEIIAANDKSTKTDLSKGFFIVNKDDGSIKFMKNEELNQEKPLDEQIKKKAIVIF